MFQTGQQIGSYTLIRELGKGGFGEVWLAEKRSQFVTKKVAVKLPLDEQVDFDAIQKEAELWEQASGHANVLPIIDADVIDGQVVIVSEYADGGSLADKLKRDGKLSTEKSVEMTIGILNGLEFLHNRGIIHRDIKPANILLQGDNPRLADFGISRAMQNTGISSVILGTGAYMSPESFRGLRTVQTDIWSVGVVLYQLLNGRLPFPKENDLERMYSIERDDFMPLASYIPPELQQIIKKALAKLPENRYASASEMREDLKKSLTVSESTPKPVVNPVPEPIPPPVDDDTTHLRPTAPPDFTKPSPVVVADKTVKVPFSPTFKSESSEEPRRYWLYLVIAALALLPFGIIGGFYWMSNQSSTETKLIPFLKGDKFGFSDVNKKIVIQPKYEYVSPFSEGLASIKLNGKWGFIDKTGKEIIVPKFDEGSFFSEGLARVSLNDKISFIDKMGKEIIPPKYDKLKDFATLDYLHSYQFVEGLAAVRLNGKWGFIDKTGKEIISPKYDEASSFSNNLAPVQINGKSGFIDKTGKEIIPPKYDDALPFSEGLAAVRLNSRWGFIDKIGKETIPIKYDTAFPFSEGLSCVTFGDYGTGKFGFIDKTGREVIAPKYDVASSFFGDVAPVKSNGKWRLIDKTGKEIVLLKYEVDGLRGVFPNLNNLFFDVKDLLSVKLNGKAFYIDKNGTEYYEP